MLRASFSKWWLLAAPLLMLDGVLCGSEPPGPSAGVQAEPTAAAGQLAARLGVRRGLCCLVGADGAQLPLELARHEGLLVYVEAASDDVTRSIRAAAAEAGILGTRLFADTLREDRLHLADNLADAVVVLGQGRGSGAPDTEELLRVVRPGGKLIQADSEQIKPVPQGSGQWTHPYHGPDNNPQADDQLARAPFITQFLATPYYGPMPEVTVSAGGRLFKAFGHISFKKREWPMLNRLIALNAYNGITLWERDLKPGFMIHRVTIVATPETLFLGGNDSCQLIDAASGIVRDEIVVDEAAGDGPCWKWMAYAGGVLYALVGPSEPDDQVIYGTRTQSGWPWNSLGPLYARKEYPWQHGRTLLAIDPTTKRVLWRHQESEPIDGRAVCMRSGRIYFYSHQNCVAAVKATDGSVVWRTSEPELLAAIGEHDPAQNPRLGFASTSYVKCNDDALYFAGPQRHRLVAVSAADGRMLWNYPVGNFQLVLREEALYAMGRDHSSKKFDLLSGTVLGDLDCFRGNCTRATGTVDSIFARGHVHGGTLRYDLASELPRRIAAMRPACQDGVISANGLLYWGPWMCDCNHTLVGVISMGPAGDFDYAQPAVESKRLEVDALDAAETSRLVASDGDWPTYRGSNVRAASTAVSVPARPRLLWQASLGPDVEPTAPIAVAGTIFVGGSDGSVRAIDAVQGQVHWTEFTGGKLHYPPSLWQGRLYSGSADGWIYCHDAASGRLVWRFRAAPVERRMPVFGRLASTWPVASGVLVADDGTAYAAAGIASHDGTHVYALDARSGKIRWQNNTSGHLMGGDVVAGVSVQGHLLLNDGKLYLAGGNVVSPAVYDAATGACLNTLIDEWEKAPRGSELFLVEEEVVAIDKMMYAPREYIPSRYFAKYLLQANSGDVVVQGTDNALMRVEPGAGAGGKARLLWQDTSFVETSAVVLAGNAVVVAAQQASPQNPEQVQPVVVALRPDDGRTLWRQRLPAPTVSWGVCIDRQGRVIVTLVDGRVLCLGG